MDIIKIVKKIDFYINNIEKTLTEIKNSKDLSKELENDLIIFDNELLKNNIEENILKKFMNILKLDYYDKFLDKYTLTDIIELNNYLKNKDDIDDININEFRRIITLSKEKIREIEESIKKYLINLRDIRIKFDYLNNQIKEYNEIKNIFNKYINKKVITEKELEVIYKFILDNPDIISKEELLDLLTLIIDSNASIYINNLEKNKKEVKEYSEDYRKIMMQEATNLIKTSSKIPISVQKKYQAINMNESIENKIDIFNSFDSIIVRKQLAILDLQKVVIPKVIKARRYANDAYQLLETSLNYIKEVEDMLTEELIKREELVNSDNRNYSLYENTDNNDLIEFIRNVDILIDDLKFLKLSKDKIDKLVKFKNETLFAYQDLLSDESEFNYNLFKTKFEDLKLEYEIMSTLYDNMHIEKEIVKSNINYDSNIKNVLVFLQDKDGNELVKEDLQSLISLNSKCKSMILKKLENLKYYDNHVKEDNNDHKLKSDNYSIEFMKKYHVKSTNTGLYRIYYSIFPSQPYNLMFIYGIKGGNLSNNSKGDYIEDILSRVYHNENIINEYINIFKSKNEIELNKIIDLSNNFLTDFNEKKEK